MIEWSYNEPPWLGKGRWWMPRKGGSQGAWYQPGRKGGTVARKARRSKRGHKSGKKGK